MNYATRDFVVKGMAFQKVWTNPCLWHFMEFPENKWKKVNKSNSTTSLKYDYDSQINRNTMCVFVYIILFNIQKIFIHVMFLLLLLLLLLLWTLSTLGVTCCAAVWWNFPYISFKHFIIYFALMVENKKETSKFITRSSNLCQGV